MTGTLFQLAEETVSKTPIEKMRELEFIQTLMLIKLAELTSLVQRDWDIKFVARSEGNGKFAVTLFPGGYELATITEKELIAFRGLIAEVRI